MEPSFLLSEKYVKLYADKDQVTPYEQALTTYLGRSPISEDLFGQAITHDLDDFDHSLWILAEKWQETLALALIIIDQGQVEQWKPLLLERVSRLNTAAPWKEFQLIALYQLIVDQLLGKSKTPLQLTQLPNGACVLENGGHIEWGEIPHPLFHAELGILAALYTFLTKDPFYLDSVEKLAKWQQCTLSGDYMPFVGLFSHEESADLEQLLVYNFFLFDLAAYTTKMRNFAAIAFKLKQKLGELTPARLATTSPFLAVLEVWLSNRKEYTIEQEASLEFSLPQTFEDRDLALVGLRSSKKNIVATLFGGGSGMGCFYYEDVQIVNFGFQHMPLGDCQGFGLSGSSRLFSKYMRTSYVSEDKLEIAGVSRMVSPVQGDHSGVWLDIKIAYESNLFTIDTQIYQLFERDLFFVLFVKAKYCSVEQGKIIHPRSLQHYRGSIDKVCLHGATSSIQVETEKRNVEVIPLSGGNNFWGADFLIAYSYPFSQTTSSSLLKLQCLL